MKRTFTILFLLVASLLLVACDGDSGPTVLKTVSMFGGTDANRGVYSGTLLDFQEEHDVIIRDKSSTSSEEWKTGVINSFSLGNEPDVLQFFTGETAKPLIDEGKVVSIETIREKYPNYANNINPLVLDDYAVPTTGFVEGIFVNTDHFKSNDSKAYLDKDAWTWDEFLDLLDLLVDENDEPDYYPIAYGVDIPHYWIDHLVASELGPDYYNEIIGTGGADKLANALYRLNELDQYLSKNTSEAISSQNFLDGKYTFQLDGSWFAGRIELENVEVFPFPKINENGSPLLSGFTSGFYITKKAWDNPVRRELAVKLVETLTSTAKLSDFVTAGGGFASDLNAKPKEESDLQVALRNLSSRIDFPVLPLGDASVSGSYPVLVESQAAFVNKNTSSALEAINEYITKQK